MDHQESKGVGWDFLKVYESFLFNHEVEICLSSSNSFIDPGAHQNDGLLIDHGGGDIFFFIIYLVFFFLSFPSPNLLSFFLMVTSLN